MQDEQQDFRRIADLSSAGLTRCSRDLRYVWANEAYAALCGVAVGQIAGRLIVDVMGQQAFDAIRPYVE